MSQYTVVHIHSTKVRCCGIRVKSSASVMILQSASVGEMNCVRNVGG
jgi:hypothetical protein